MHIYKQYTDLNLHILSQMSCNYWIKFTTFQQQDKDMFFFFPLVEVYCVGVYVNIVFFFFLTAALKWREPCATQAKK